VLDVTITELAAGGLGLARAPDGSALFVEAVAPGDRVRVAVTGKVRATLLDVLEPGPDRVTPPCPFSKRCGGCDWMHLSPEAQTAAHVRIVAAQLSHALGEPVSPEPWTPPALERSRTRARLRVEANGGAAKVGYRVTRSHDLAVVDDCLVLEAALFAAARAATRWVDGGRGAGELSIGWGRRPRDGAKAPVVDLSWSGELPATFWARASEACGEPGLLAGVRVALEGARVPTTIGDPRPVQVGFDGQPVFVRAGGFAQASDEGAAALAAKVRELAEPEGRDVLELFSGSGTLSIALAPGALRFSSLEVDAEAVACARENLVRRGLTGKLAVGDADTTVVSTAHEVVVLDPPRRGAPGAVAAIAKARSRVVVYVSCDSATLARDAKVLAESGYALDRVLTLGLFPFTSHVETVARFVRQAKRKPR
jgi:23S rRNA (uracil1939-C5)-methyltransferase